MTALASSYYDADLVQAWKQATTALANQANTPYVIVTSFGDAWARGKAGLKALDAVARDAGFEAPSSVASVLCPRIVRLSGGSVSEAIESGQIMLGKGRKRGLNFSGWRHTYFERLTGVWYDRFGVRQVIKTNRLLTAIDKLNQWGKNSEAALYLHTDLPSDTFRTRGSPCLQYVQIRSYGTKQVSLGAVYRSHDYSNKALGNFFGLHELGNFIADRTGRSFEGVDIVSFNPFVSGKASTNEFVARI